MSVKKKSNILSSVKDWRLFGDLYETLLLSATPKYIVVMMMYDGISRVKIKVLIYNSFKMFPYAFYLQFCILITH